MADDLLRYDKIVETQLRGVVRAALNQILEHGLPGTHSIYITFRTGEPGVELPDLLRKEYPEEMTIVLEHQFWNLAVGEDGFEVELSFNKERERVAVPFAAMTVYRDPGAKFGLSFERPGAEGPGAEGPGAEGEDAPAKLADRRAATDAAQGDADQADADDVGEEAGQVVNLDAFRKK